VVIEQRVENMNPQDTENVLIHEIGSLIISDSAYAEPFWITAAIVYNFVDGRKNSYGYVFYHDGSWKAELPDDSFDDQKKMVELQSIMERRTGKKWHRALVHITRKTGAMNITFEYDDLERWSINPSNLEDSVKVLRP
jgi:hypothetical protein